MADMRITVPCPQCHKSTVKPLSELEACNSVTCPSCGTVIDLTKYEWRVALRQARESAEQIIPKP
jgi:endogenous inhibitor of DNA gyrase (YacG/DUF329 family)